MFAKFDEEAQKVLVDAKKEMFSLLHPYVGSEHMLLAILTNKELKLTKVLGDYGINYEDFRNEIIKVIGKGSNSNSWFLFTPLLKRIIETASLDSKDNNEGMVTVNHLFMALLEEGEGVAIRILLGMNIDLDKIYQYFSTNLIPKTKKNKKKLYIEDFAVDLNKKAETKELDPVIGRDEEVNRLIEILSRRTKNNPLLIGDAGVGKTAIVEELSRRIVNHLVPNNLLNKRVLSLSMAGLVAGTKYRGEFEERINKIIKEVEENKEIILFIDEIHTLAGAGGAEGAIDASNILKPALARGKLRLIGATTTLEYKEHLLVDKALERRFQTIMINEPDDAKTYKILLNLKEIYEDFHGVTISNNNLKLIVELTNKYIYGRKQPDKAIDILDEVCAKTSLTVNKNDEKLNNYYEKLTQIRLEKSDTILKQDFQRALVLKNEENKIESTLNKMQLQIAKDKCKKKINKEDIAEIIHLKTQIPVYEIIDENNSLLNLEKKIRKVVIGQDDAITSLVNWTKRIKLGLKNENHPTSLLFAGPTGVGKTLLTKIYAKHLVGDSNLIRLDMSEFKESHSVSKIVGSPPGYVGYNNYMNILEEVKNKPYSVVLLDEIEKAHPDVINLFLQILDEGFIKDSRGDVVRFDNTIIIMTSNVGSNKQSLGFYRDNILENSSKIREYFSVEFINRIDNIVFFKPLTEENIRLIIKNEIKSLTDKFKSKKISVFVSDSIINEIIKECRYLEYGARRVKKVIIEKLEHDLVNQVLMGRKAIHI